MAKVIADDKPERPISIYDTSGRPDGFAESAKIVDDLFKRSSRLCGPNHAFRAFKEFMIHTSHLSPFNAMLVYVQRPGSNAVFTKKQWAKLGREIAPDAIPIVILRPFGPISFVFDHSDTVGPPLPGEHYLDASKVFGRSKYLDWERVCAGAKKCGIHVELTDQYGVHRGGTAARLVAISRIPGAIERTSNALPTNRKAKADFDSELSVLWRIKINGRLSDESRIATLAHELGHIYCGHLGPGPWGEWRNRRDELNGSQREMEAEAVAYLTCIRTGLMPASELYISKHHSDENIEKISIPAIVAAMQRIEKGSL